MEWTLTKEVLKWLMLLGAAALALMTLAGVGMGLVVWMNL